MLRNREIPDIPINKLSQQQKAIYLLAKQNIGNKEIAHILGLEPRNVAMQLSRIRKKAENLPITYKIEPGAEHTQKSVPSPLQELKGIVQNDPGYVSLMYQRYGTNRRPLKERRSQLAAAGKESGYLYKERAKAIRTLSVASKYGEEFFLLKLTREQVRQLKGFFSQRGLKPIDNFWEDGSSLYKIHLVDFIEIRKLLEYE